MSAKLCGKFSVRNGRVYVLVNVTSGQVCVVDVNNGSTLGSRSTCYRVRRELSRAYPEQRYVVARLMSRGKVIEV